MACHDDALIASLVSGDSYEEAALAAGCGARTVSRRMADPAFRQALQEARAEVLSRATSKVSCAMTKAVDTLVKLLDSLNDTASLGAARAILDGACKLRSAVEIESRLAALESALAQSEKGKKT
jgi:uncharacterized coiled-coil protein SlyX